MKCTITAPYGPDCPLHNQVAFSPDDSLVLTIAVPIGDPTARLSDQLSYVAISDGTNQFSIKATVGQLSHIWGQLGKALDEIKGDE